MELIRILSIDGGGIRGVIPATILVTLEKLIQKYSGRSDARIGEYFDFIAGTSTGGILTALYLCPDKKNPKRSKMSAEEIAKFYIEDGENIFHKSIKHTVASAFGLFGSKYGCKNLEDKCKELVGEIKLSEILKPCLITSYDINNNSTIFFNKADAFADKEKDFYLRDVIRATSAAPAYFEPAYIKSIAGTEYTMIDGGVFANNPSMCAYVEATKLRYNLNADKMIVLSIGTGSYNKNFRINKNSGLINWAFPLFYMNMSGVSDSVDYQLRTIYESVDKNYYYLRVDKDLREYPRSIFEIDNTSKKNIRLLQEAGSKAAYESLHELDNFAKLLVYKDFSLIKEKSS